MASLCRLDPSVNVTEPPIARTMEVRRGAFVNDQDRLRAFTSLVSGDARASSLPTSPQSDRGGRRAVSRSVRGSSWFNVVLAINSFNRHDGGAVFESSEIGFRVVTVPEPCSFVLAALGLIGPVVWQRGKR